MGAKHGALDTVLTAVRHGSCWRQRRHLQDQAFISQSKPLSFRLKTRTLAVKEGRVESGADERTCPIIRLAAGALFWREVRARDFIP